MKKIFTLIAVAVMAMGVNAQGTYGVKSGDAGVAAGSQLTSVRNITMTWGVSGGESFKDAKGDNTLEEALGATGYCEGNGENGGFNKGTVYYFEPTEAGKLTVGIVLNANKAFFVKDASENDIAFTCTNAKGESITFGADGKVDTKLTGGLVTFSVEAGQKYAVYCSGSKLGFYGFKYEAGNSQETGGADVWDAASLPFDEKTKTILDVTTADNESSGYIIPASVKQFPEGTYPSNISDVTAWLSQQEDPSIYSITLKDYIFTASTANVSLKAVSTPNASENDKPDVECWQSAGGAESNMALNTDDCPIKWTNYIKAKNGNPGLAYYNFYDTNSDGDAVNRVGDDLWSIGCGKVPSKGSYFEFTFKKAGSMVMGVYLNRPHQSSVVVIDKETLAPLAYTDLSFKGFCQNNTIKYPDNSEESTDPTFQAFQFRDDYTIDVSANSGRPLIGYLSFPVEAKTYMVFQPSSQLGIYGFQFTEGGSTNGVETITANKVWNADAPMYNLAGQKVDKSYKGIVIQNGRKFYNK